MDLEATVLFVLAEVAVVVVHWVVERTRLPEAALLTVGGSPTRSSRARTSCWTPTWSSRW